MQKNVLILGSSGNAGRHAKSAFENAGWNVSTYRRGTDMAKAADGVDIIFNGLNPPGYHDWATNLPAITSQVIAAAKSSGARVVLPGNVYNFGVQPAPWGPDTAQIPITEKGEIRVQIERMYRASGIPTLVLRAGDFVAETGKGLWWDLAVTQPLKKGAIKYPAPMNTLHIWTYLPDFARAVVALCDQPDKLGDFADIPFVGHALTGSEILSAAQRLRPGTKQKAFDWWALRLAAPFWGTGREVLKMRYLWSHPHWFESAPFDELLPEFVSTPLETMLQRGLEGDVHPNEPMVRTYRAA